MLGNENRPSSRSSSLRRHQLDQRSIGVGKQRRHHLLVVAGYLRASQPTAIQQPGHQLLPVARLGKWLAHDPCAPFTWIIHNISFSLHQIFLLAHCEDNGLYLRTLATGTELHQLKGHKSKVNRNVNVWHLHLLKRLFASCREWEAKRAW